MRMLMSALLVCAAGAANAQWTDTLQARDLNGDGTADAYYDTAQNITWLGDANYAATIHLFEGEPRGVPFTPEPGQLSWVEATAWAPTVNLSGITGWRLPVTFMPEGSLCTPSSCGYASELSSLYDLLQGGSGPFENMQSSYFSGNLLESFTGVNRFQYTNMFTGARQSSNETSVIGLYAWLVHDGDVGVSPIPEPSTYGLMLAGLGAVGFFARRRRAAWCGLRSSLGAV